MLVAIKLAVVLFGKHEDRHAVIFGNDFRDFTDLDLANSLGKSSTLGLGEELVHDTASLLGFLIVAIHSGELSKRSLLGTNLGCKTL